MKENIYDDLFDHDAVSAGLHRSAVGGHWDKLGQVQLDFMVEQGLAPDDDFLDMGCGCLRGGVHFIRYLEADKYYGCDVNDSLLDAGYDIELPLVDLQNKLSRGHLLADDGFRVSKLEKQFKYALAFSLFTHLSMNSIRR